MPLPVITDVWRITLRWSANSGTPPFIARSVFHLLAPGKTAAQIRTALDGAWQANQTAWMPSTYGLRGYDVLPLNGVAPTTSFTPASPISGQVAGDSIVAVACLLKWRTAQRGPAHRGRTFLPFVNEARQAGGIMDPTTVTNLSTAWDAWRAALAAGGFTPVVASYVHSTAATCTSIAAESLVGTQRRRQQQLRK